MQTPDANLGQGMQWLGLAYSSWFNARHQPVGPLFQGRFKSVPAESSAWAYKVEKFRDVLGIGGAECLESLKALAGEGGA